MLDQPVREVMVRALPDALPDGIEVDVSELEAGGVLTVGDITAPAGVELVDDPEIVVASVTAALARRDRRGGGGGRRGRGRARDRGTCRRRRVGVARRPSRTRPSASSSASATPSRATRARATTPARWSWSDCAERLGAGRFKQRYAGRFAEAPRPRRAARAAGPHDLHEPLRRLGRARRRAPARPRRAQVLVVHDELDLPFGVVRGKIGGGHGGHNGLRSITRGPGQRRLPPRAPRRSAGRPPSSAATRPTGCSPRFASRARRSTRCSPRPLAMAEVALAEGMDAAIARFHAAEPGSRARARGSAATAPAERWARRGGRPAGRRHERAHLDRARPRRARRWRPPPRASAREARRARSRWPRPAWPFVLAALHRTVRPRAARGGAGRRRGAGPRDAS